MSDRFMIYGATGYTGKLIIRTAKALGMSPLIAGRTEARLKSLGAQHGLEYMAFGLDDPQAIDAALSQVDVVLHIAGPFSATSSPMLDACLRTGTHYLDITGEIDVFEAAAARDGEAKAANIMVLPGCGFDVVPSDCLAAHMKRRMPDATELTISIAGLGGLSRGTAKSGVEGVGKGIRVRREGKIVRARPVPRRTLDMGEGPKPFIGMPWGDVSTAYHSTGIPDITVYFQSSPQLEQMAKLGFFGRWIASRGFMQSRLKRQIELAVEGPSEAARRAGRCLLLGEAVNGAGEKVATRLRTPEGYTLTAMTSLEIVSRVLAGELIPGFQTPSSVYGPDFILEFDGCHREDINH